MTPIENPEAVTQALVDWLIVDDASDGICLKGEQSA
jgi:hypothetical protein